MLSSSLETLPDGTFLGVLSTSRNITGTTPKRLLVAAFKFMTTGFEPQLDILTFTPCEMEDYLKGITTIAAHLNQGLFQSFVVQEAFRAGKRLVKEVYNLGQHKKGFYDHVELADFVDFVRGTHGAGRSTNRCAESLLGADSPLARLVVHVKRQELSKQRPLETSVMCKCGYGTY